MVGEVESEAWKETNSDIEYDIVAAIILTLLLHFSTIQLVPIENASKWLVPLQIF